MPGILAAFEPHQVREHHEHAVLLRQPGTTRSQRTMLAEARPSSSTLVPRAREALAR
jgi:hypothetical protein